MRQPGDPPARILIVDDHDDAREVFAELLQVEGYATLVAADGETAVRMAIEERPDVVLMDVGMPGMDGVEATRLLKADARSARISIIAVTGQGPRAARAMIDAGCDAVCMKPCAPVTLVQEIEKALARRALRS